MKYNYTNAALTIIWIIITLAFAWRVSSMLTH